MKTQTRQTRALVDEDCDLRSWFLPGWIHAETRRVFPWTPCECWKGRPRNGTPWCGSALCRLCRGPAEDINSYFVYSDSVTVAATVWEQKKKTCLIYPMHRQIWPYRLLFVSSGDLKLDLNSTFAALCINTFMALYKRSAKYEGWFFTLRTAKQGETKKELRRGHRTDVHSSVHCDKLKSRILWDLKGNSTACTHESVFTGLGEYYCICQKSSIKYFVAWCSVNGQVAFWVM